MKTQVLRSGLYQTAICEGKVQITTDMLEQQKALIERIEQQREIMQCEFVSTDLTVEQREKIVFLDKIKNIENVYLRIMQRQHKSN